jgi:predicted ATPase/DNA-binding CsgD family transcriptional regulator/transcriptional regulator with XRE-family HTH domain/Tfp pilus assembly protein PilF
MSEPAAFGPWLRQLRRARDLTQEALGQQAGCGADTVKKIEAGQRRPSRPLAQRLATALGLSDAERATFLAAARRPGPISSPATLAAPRPSHVPLPTTPLIGRAWELANLQQLLVSGTTRLVTLVGPGGTGKTRLALAAADSCARVFADGVHFVSLASASRVEEVAPAIARTIGLREMGSATLSEQLRTYLADRALLLVLDNFEHLLPAAPQIAAMLSDAPRVVVVVTSRAPLRLIGEQEFPVPPLAVPARVQLPPLEQLEQYAAITLFVARARSLRPDFTLDAQNAPLVTAICRQLDGLPLAIELAVARLKLFTLTDLIDRLAQPLGLLVGGPRDAPQRQQTLAATIDWSFQLLRAAEQRCFARLAVFVDGCTLSDAEAVCGDPAAPISDQLAALVEHSLVQRDAQLVVDGRLVMLDTIRAYALEQLSTSGEYATIRERHAGAFLALAEQALTELYGPYQLRWLQRLDAERGNLHAALTWWGTENPSRALALATALWPFWDLRGHFHEGRAWLVELLPRALDAPAAVRAGALHAIGHFASFQGDYAVAEQALRQSLKLFSELHLPARAAHVRCALGLLAWFRGDHTQALSELEASVAQARAANAIWETADALHYLGHVVVDRGDDARAERIFQESLALFRRTGDQRNIALPLKDLGLIVSQRGDDTTALPLYRESLASSRAIEDTWHIADTLLRLGDLARRSGDLVQAQAFYAEALEGWRRMGARGGEAETLNLLGHAALEQRDLPNARRYYQESLALQQASGSPRVIASLHYSLGQVAWHAGDPAVAEDAYRTSLELNAQADYLPGVGDCLLGLAELAAFSQQGARAALLLGAAGRLRDLPRGFMPLADHTIGERTARAVADLLTPAELAARCAEGRALTLEQALALVRLPMASAPLARHLQQSHDSPVSALQQLGLTAREAEVLLLVARGLTDQQVATALVVSIRTVQSHLRTIFSKLGCTTRTAAAHIAHTALRNP